MGYSVRFHLYRSQAVDMFDKGVRLEAAPARLAVRRQYRTLRRCGVDRMMARHTVQELLTAALWGTVEYEGWHLVKRSTVTITGLGLVEAVAS